MPSRTASHCACGTSFSIEHVLSCPKGGFPSIRHNEVRNCTDELLSEVCNDVEIEPHLQPLMMKPFKRRLLMFCNKWLLGWPSWNTDIRVFNPLACSNCGTTLSTCYRKHKTCQEEGLWVKNREVEHSSFTPLVLSATGGMGHEASVFYEWFCCFMTNGIQQLLTCACFFCPALEA